MHLIYIRSAKKGLYEISWIGTNNIILFFFLIHAKKFTKKVGQITCRYCDCVTVALAAFSHPTGDIGPNCSLISIYISLIVYRKQITIFCKICAKRSVNISRSYHPFVVAVIASQLQWRPLPLPVRWHKYPRVSPHS